MMASRSSTTWRRCSRAASLLSRESVMVCLLLSGWSESALEAMYLGVRRQTLDRLRPRFWQPQPVLRNQAAHDLAGAPVDGGADGLAVAELDVAGAVAVLEQGPGRRQVHQLPGILQIGLGGEQLGDRAEVAAPRYPVVGGPQGAVAQHPGHLVLDRHPGEAQAGVARGDDGLAAAPVAPRPGHGVVEHALVIEAV